jgi:hypothetical protein
MSLADRIRSILAPTPARPGKRIEVTCIAQTTIRANTPANSVNTTTFIIDPTKPADNKLQVYKGETWVVEDIFVTSAPAIDLILKFIKNDTELVQQTQPLSTYNINNPAKPRISPIVLKEFEKLTIDAINMSAGGNSDTTITFYIKLARYV